MAEEALDLQDVEDIQEIEDENISENVSEQEIIQYVEDFNPDNPTKEQAAAMAQGWRPEGVEGKDPVSSKEFLARQPLFDRLHKQDQMLKKQSKAIDSLVQQSNEIADKARERTIRELEAKKYAAVEDGDVDKVRELDKEINETRAETTKLKSSTEKLTPDLVQSVWQEEANNWEADTKNSWYKNDPTLKEFAEFQITKFAQKYNEPAQDEDELRERYISALKYMEKQVKETFPEKFMSASKRPAAVANATRKPTAKKSKPSIDNIKDPAIRDVALTIKRQNGNIEGYLASLEKSGYFD